ncbi:hypothetical protein Clacol_008344 [Clathrus columnatus]|uniref:NAD(P)-binding domain-containing protein n=1 Tax=Clathrus columnatus TaxID=1419009 RepID=A0AAV5AHG4_9AGAM|nr:hypothetical protein Clacol_008344 [Clathrus columnatus]
MNEVVIIGGHGKIAMRLTRLLVDNGFSVTSVIRNPTDSNDIVNIKAKPEIISLEEADVATFTALFETTNAKLVYFIAGAGGKGGPERTKTVDFEGAVKIFDAIEGVKNIKPRLILVGAIDARDPNRLEDYPSHYSEQDKDISRRAHEILKDYYIWKYEADKNLSQRTSFEWTILRPTSLDDTSGTGTAEIGFTQLGIPISRDDVAEALFHLASRIQAHGLILDMIGGNTPIAEALDSAIQKRESAQI